MVNDRVCEFSLRNRQAHFSAYFRKNAWSTTISRLIITRFQPKRSICLSVSLQLTHDHGYLAENVEIRGVFV